MDRRGRNPGRKLLRIKTVQGEPYQVGERRLTPVARIVSWGKASATVGTRQVAGQGGGLVRVTPLAIVEETSDGQRLIPITDATAAAVRKMLGATVATLLFFATIRWLVRRVLRLGSITRPASTPGAQYSGRVESCH